MSGQDQTLVREAIVAAWSRALDTPIELDDDVIRLGAHSLLAAQVLYELEQQLGVTIPFDLVFSTATVGEFVAAVSKLSRI